MAHLIRVEDQRKTDAPAISVERIFPTRKSLEEATYFGFEITKENAQRLATQLLMAAELRDKCRLYYNKDTKACYVEIEKGEE